MKIDINHVPMPIIKFYVYVWLLIIGSILALFLVYVALNQGLTKDQLVSLLVSAVLTLLVLSVTELVPEFFRRYAANAKESKFWRFFGEEALKHPVHFVFPYCTLENSSPDVLKYHHSLPSENDLPPPRPEGITGWLPINDVLASIQLANAFAKYSKLEIKVIHDKEVANDFEYCAISFGLGFNGFTDRLSKAFNGRLFKPFCGNSPKPTFTDSTDLIQIGTDILIPPNGYDDAIVARVVFKTEEGKPLRVCFLCAGRTAHGTAVAGYFLANSWPDLLQIYDSEPTKDLKYDSLAVLIRHSEGPQSDLSSVHIVTNDNGKNILAWERANGVG
jgi:hypothetical protein